MEPRPRHYRAQTMICPPSGTHSAISIQWIELIADTKTSKIVAASVGGAIPHPILRLGPRPHLCLLLSPRLSPLLSPLLSPRPRPRLRPRLSQRLSPLLSQRLSPLLGPCRSPRLRPLLSPCLSPRLSPLLSPRLSPPLSRSQKNAVQYQTIRPAPLTAIAPGFARRSRPLGRVMAQAFVRVPPSRLS